MRRFIDLADPAQDGYGNPSYEQCFSLAAVGITLDKALSAIR